MNASITDFFPVHKRKHNKIEKSKNNEEETEKQENLEHVDVYFICYIHKIEDPKKIRI